MGTDKWSKVNDMRNEIREHFQFNGQYIIEIEKPYKKYFKLVIIVIIIKQEHMDKIQDKFNLFGWRRIVYNTIATFKLV